jgi:hypothetical protein
MPRYKVEKVKIGIGKRRVFAFGKPRMFIYDLVYGKKLISRYPTKEQADFDCKRLKKVV